MKLLIALFLFFPSKTSIVIPPKALHPIHVSVADLTYKRDADVVQIAKRIFTDDLEDQLTRLGLVDFRIDKKGRSADVNVALNSYLNKRLTLRIDGKTVAGKLLGHEFEGLATWFYFEYTLDEQIRSSVEISDTTMMEVFDDQENIWHLNLKGDKKALQSFTLTSEQPRIEINW